MLTGAQRALWQRSSDLFAVLDAESRIVEINPAWEHLLGWSREQLLGHRWWEWVHDDERSAAARAMADDLRRFGSVSGLEARYRAADGSYRWMLWGGDVQDGRAFVVGRDISARRLAHAALRRSRERATTIDEALHAGLLVVSFDLVVLEANDRFCAMVGRERDAVVGMRAPHPWWPVEDRDAMLEASANPTEMTGGRARFMRADGQVFEIRADVGFLPGEGDEPRILAIIHDLSELLAEADLPGLEPAGGT